VVGRGRSRLPVVGGSGDGDKTTARTIPITGTTGTQVVWDRRWRGRVAMAAM